MTTLSQRLNNPEHMATVVERLSSAPKVAPVAAPVKPQVQQVQAGTPLMAPPAQQQSQAPDVGQLMSTGKMITGGEGGLGSMIGGGSAATTGGSAAGGSGAAGTVSTSGGMGSAMWANPWAAVALGIGALADHNTRKGYHSWDDVRDGRGISSMTDSEHGHPGLKSISRQSDKILGEGGGDFFEGSLQVFDANPLSQLQGIEKSARSAVDIFKGIF